MNFIIQGKQHKSNLGTTLETIGTRMQLQEELSDIPPYVLVRVCTLWFLRHIEAGVVRSGLAEATMYCTTPASIQLRNHRLHTLN